MIDYTTNHISSVKRKYMIVLGKKLHGDELLVVHITIEGQRKCKRTVSKYASHSNPQPRLVDNGPPTPSYVSPFRRNFTLHIQYKYANTKKQNDNRIHIPTLTLFVSKYLVGQIINDNHPPR